MTATNLLVVASRSGLSYFHRAHLAGGCLVVVVVENGPVKCTMIVGQGSHL